MSVCPAVQRLRDELGAVLFRSGGWCDHDAQQSLGGGFMNPVIFGVVAGARRDGARTSPVCPCTRSFGAKTIRGADL